ncbi:MAG: hypothetical protein QOG91_220 [Candidatus Parcubacteria bacterium]|jgi:cell division protein FtsB|nr:hypothetical protein [Candidatus Parcubacteria bacterium]
MKYGKRPFAKRFLASPFLLAGLLIILIILARASANIRDKAFLSAQRLAQAQTDLGKLEARQKELETQVGYLGSEQGIEAELRTKYRAVKEGESVAVIVDADQTAAALSASSTPVAPASPRTSWWQKIVQSFGL